MIVEKLVLKIGYSHHIMVSSCLFERYTVFSIQKSSLYSNGGQNKQLNIFSTDKHATAKIKIDGSPRGNNDTSLEVENNSAYPT
jgi:hypothetical protein